MFTLMLYAYIYNPLPQLHSHSFFLIKILLNIQYFFFGKCFNKKTIEYFLKFLFFFLNVQSFRLLIENIFIQIGAPAGHAVAYTIGQIFKHIFRLCAAVFHHWHHEYCTLKRQLSLACRRNTYL